MTSNMKKSLTMMARIKDNIKKQLEKTRDMVVSPVQKRRTELLEAADEARDLMNDSRYPKFQEWLKSLVSMYEYENKRAGLGTNTESVVLNVVRATAKIQVLETILDRPEILVNQAEAATREKRMVS